jgi:hypothetical protein
MPAGAPGDDPLIDVVTYGRSVFTPEIDELIRQLAENDKLQSSLAIEYVRQMPTLLAWIDEVGRLSGRSMADIREQRLRDFQDTLERELLGRSTLETIVDTISGRTYSRTELISSLRAMRDDDLRAVERDRGPIDGWDVHELYTVYRSLNRSEE